MKTKITLIILSISLLYNCSAQTFTRVINPLDPVTTDAVASGGGSWIDINNDGLLDLFVSNGNLTSVNNSLYLNNGNGNFIRVTTGNIVNDAGSSIGSTWGDYDNDGFPDCFVTNRSNFGNFLYHGTGDTVFTKITSGNIVTDIGDGNSSSWIDIDNDGVLDLYAVNFMNIDFLYKGDGAPGFTFSSTTPLNTGVGFSIPGAWADYNNDLFPDLFIGNSGTQNDFLYTNGGSFNFVQSTFMDSMATLGASWGDYNNDGNLDLFVANYLNQPSILYINSGPPSYTLSPVTGNGLTTSGNSVGSCWADIDNDGDLDLFVADDGGNNHLFVNSGFPDYTFTAVTTGAIVTDGGNSFGCTFGDYDNDGQLDLFVANRLNQQNFLYHNDGNNNHWITIKCVGTNSNKSGIGTKVYVKANVNGNPIWQMQEVASQSGYNSENLWLHFGTGNASILDTVVVKWPSGTVDSCYNVSTNQFFIAEEGSCLTTGLGNNSNNNLKEITLYSFPNPAKTNTEITYQLRHSTKVTLQVFDLSGKLISTLKNETEAAGNHQLNYNVEKLPSGIYSLKLSSEESSINTKLIVE